MFSRRSKTCWPMSACSRPLVGVWTASSLMSAPATKALSPAPVRITARTLSSCFRSSTARRSSSIVCEFSALRTLGRLTVTTAIAPSRSRRRLSKAIAVLQRKRIHQPAENDGRRDESCKHQSPEPHLMSRLVLGNHCEDDRDEKRKQDEKKDVAPHEGYFLRYFLRYFRPTATSYASITTSRFNSP